jgi:D-3-phosphoglycerate dehydrogenase / 2-oxoglutarate reductase
MSKDQGKVRTVRSLKLKKDLYIIGDGYTDYELRKLGLAKKFIAFTENVARKNVVTKADQIAETFDEFLYVNKLPRTLSYPKNRISAALVDEISHEEIQLFEKEGYKVFTKPTKEELLKASIICTSQNSIKRVPIDSVHALAIGFYTNHLLNETYTSHGIAVFSKKNVAKRIIAYINSGTTAHSTSLPNLQLPRYKSSHRLLHIHKNVPGMLAQINDVMASHDINILGQYLRTNEQIGYVIIDVDKEYDSGVIKALRSIPDTIRFRVLY